MSVSHETLFFRDYKLNQLSRGKLHYFVKICTDNVLILITVKYGLNVLPYVHMQYL